MSFTANADIELGTEEIMENKTHEIIPALAEFTFSYGRQGVSKKKQITILDILGRKQMEF